jgi:hypothetical protein
MEMYTRWIQAGAFSGVMRSHDRGMSAGDCDNAQPSTCSVVQPWKVPPAFLPANVAALQAREELLPYIYTQARAAFDTEEAYLTDANGTFSQYMFGPSILVAPIVTQGNAFLGGGLLTSKTVWLPPGAWYCTVSGDVVQSSSLFVTKNYTIDEIPSWCAQLCLFTLCCTYRGLISARHRHVFHACLAAGTELAPSSPTSPCATCPSLASHPNPTRFSVSESPRVQRAGQGLCTKTTVRPLRTWTAITVTPLWSTLGFLPASSTP